LRVRAAARSLFRLHAFKDKNMTASGHAKIIARKNVFDGYHQLELVTVQPKSLKHDGFAGEMTRDVFYCKEVVSVLLYIPETDEILLNQQFRTGALMAGADDPFLLECSAGAIDDGESPEDAAKREALEETGSAVRELVFISNAYSSPGCVAEKWHLYVGRVMDAAPGLHGLESEAEEIKTHLLPAARVFDMLDNGRITNISTAMMLNWFARHKDSLRRRWLNEKDQAS
jgi:ADP-ribose pyrophosphatase